MSVPPILLTPEGRRAAAFAAILGGCACMTVYASIVLYIVGGNAKLAFYLGLAAHAQILVGLTALGALLVKRTLKVGREGIEITDSAEPASITMTAEVKK